MNTPPIKTLHVRIVPLRPEGQWTKSLASPRNSGTSGYLREEGMKRRHPVLSPTLQKRTCRLNQNALERKTLRNQKLKSLGLNQYPIQGEKVSWLNQSSFTRK